jgi:glycosyltransferase involved in cell wall biosynthesis
MDIKYSIVIPVYNSSSILPKLYEKLTGVLESLSFNYEIIFVDDGSREDTWEVLKSIFKEDKKVKVIRLSKNFGQHNATMAGFHRAQGEYIITMDDDLQHTPDEIPNLLKEIKKGYDVVYGLYKIKKHGLGRNIGSKIIRYYYKKVFKVTSSTSSFRILRRNIVNKLLEYDRSFIYIDGLIAWTTDCVSTIKITHKERELGRSGYSLGKLVGLAMNMMTTFSLVPLKLASVLGLIFSSTGFLLAIFYFVKKIIWGVVEPGFTSIIIAITFFAGVQLLTLGIIGEYLGRLHLNINERPQFVERTVLENKEIK